MECVQLQPNSLGDESVQEAIYHVLSSARHPISAGPNDLRRQIFTKVTSVHANICLSFCSRQFPNSAPRSPTAIPVVVSQVIPRTEAFIHSCALRAHLGHDSK
eukprot:5702021-Heterocapsa_arctica.AAC.1